MHRFRNLLVALDGSSSSLHALEEAIRLSQWGKGRVTAITVAPLYEGDLSLVGVKNIKAAMAGPSEEILVRAMKIGDRLGAELDLICEEGEPYLQIIGHAQTTGSDLIVMGARNEKALAGWLPGSMASKVIEHSPRSVLVIPERATLGWERILLATDTSRYGREAWEEAIALAASHASEMKAVFLPERRLLRGTGSGEDPDVESSNKAYQRLLALAKRAGITCDLLPPPPKSGRAIRDLAEKHGIGLILLGRQVKKRLFGWVPTDIAHRLIHVAPCPVLVLRCPLYTGKSLP